MTHHRAPLIAGLLALALVACTEKTPAPAGGPEAAPATGEAATAGQDPAAGAKTPGAKTPPAKTLPARTPPKAPGTPPRVAAAVSAQHTVAIAGFEGLDAVAREAAASMDALRASLPEAPPPEADPEKWAGTLGFDPRAAAGWQQVGIDPAAGVAVVLDNRLKVGDGDNDPVPVLMLKITDRGKLLAHLTRRGQAVTIGEPGPDGVSEATGPAGHALVGARQGWTAVMFDTPEDRRAAIRAQFADWLTGEGPALAASQKLAPTLLMPGETRLFGVLNADALARMLPDDAGLTPEAQFYVNRFPAVGLGYSFADGQGQLRVQADGQGVRGLRQILVPEAPVVKAARFAPPGAVGSGWSLNLEQLFDGVQTLIPPNRGDLAGQVLLARNGLPVAIGLSWEDLSQALTGHVTLLMDPIQFARPSAQPDFVIVAGLADAAALDRTITFLFNKLSKQDPSNAVEKTQIGGQPGYTFKVGGAPPGFMAVLDDAILVGPRRDTLEAAIARAGAAPPPALANLDAPGFLRAAVPLDSIKAAAANAPPEAQEAMKAGVDFWSQKLGGALSPTVRVDDHGVVADGPSSVAVVGIGAAVAIPAFIKYMKRAKESEARVNLQRIYSGALMAAMQGETPAVGVPATAPLTPAADPCAAGDAFYTATAETFAHPTWKALGFQPTGKMYYRYGFEKTADGFVARAVGDLDCDGLASTYEMRATPTPEGGGFVGTPNDINPLE